MVLATMSEGIISISTGDGNENWRGEVVQEGAASQHSVPDTGWQSSSLPLPPPPPPPPPHHGA